MKCLGMEYTFGLKNVKRERVMFLGQKEPYEVVWEKSKVLFQNEAQKD